MMRLCINSKYLILSIFIFVSFFNTAYANSPTCRGKMVNPITDICWSCIFPISIGSVPVGYGATQAPDTSNPALPIGYCPAPPPVFERIGVNVGYWEPVKLVDVVRQPFCMQNLGISIKNSPTELGGETSSYGNIGHKSSFYDVHWYEYPLFSLLQLIVSLSCGYTPLGLDIAYMTEFDPLWQDEQSAAIFSPEAALFSNPISALACAPEAAIQLFGTALPIDALFWCLGGQGLAYPFTGQVDAEHSSIQAATLLMERFNYKLHRTGIVNETVGSNPANCMEFPSPMLPKSRWRYQMTSPIALPSTCYPYGTTTVLWESAIEQPTSIKNFGFVNFRKRNCVVF